MSRANRRNWASGYFSRAASSVAAPKQCFRIERLGDKVVGAGRQPSDDMVGAAVAGEQDEIDVVGRSLADFLAQCRPVEPRHVPIGDDQAVNALVNPIEGLVAV